MAAGKLTSRFGDGNSSVGGSWDRGPFGAATSGFSPGPRCCCFRRHHTWLNQICRKVSLSGILKWISHWSTLTRWSICKLSTRNGPWLWHVVWNNICSCDGWMLVYVIDTLHHIFVVVRLKCLYRHIRPVTIYSRLTHWGRDEMGNILQTTFSNVFSSMKMFEVRLRFHWSLFLGVQLTILQHWFR